MADDLSTADGSVTVGRRHVEDGAEKVILTGENQSDVKADLGVTCTALVDGEPIETHGLVIYAVPPHGKGYENIDFFDTPGKHSVIHCVVDVISKTDE